MLLRYLDRKIFQLTFNDNRDMFEYYMNWPNKLSQEEVKNGCFLLSLTPAEELGLFLEIRGHCLYDEGKTAEAMVMYAYAYQLMPDSMARLANIEKVLKYEVNNLR